MFKFGFFSFISNASLKRRIFQILWQSVILAFICTKFIRDDFGSSALLTILSENTDGVNLALLNTY